jgi:release factor glutamine methyltransferase
MSDYSISRAIDEAAGTLDDAGVADPRREAASLLGFVLGCDRAYLIINAAESLTPADVERLTEVVRRRAAREPFQHITGVQEFYGLEFCVSPEVLIPRPETELLVETALSLIGPDAPPQRICDVGIGSGAILITFLHERPQLRGIGLDISGPALELARQNAEALGVADRIEFRKSDCFAALEQGIDRFSLITANPPYIREEHFADLQPEVRDFEPRIALTPGGDGLDVVRQIIADAPDFLVSGGHLLIEIGFDQAEEVGTLIDRRIWPEFEILPDLQGIPRCVVLRRA